MFKHQLIMVRLERSVAGHAHEIRLVVGHLTELGVERGQMHASHILVYALEPTISHPTELLRQEVDFGLVAAVGRRPQLAQR